MTIAISGAGLIGRLLAWQALNHGLSVDLYDHDTPEAQQSAAWVAAAMLAPISESVKAPDVLAMGNDSLQRWPALLAKLTQATQQPINYYRSGTMVVAHTPDHAYLTQFTAHLRANSDTQYAFSELDAATLAQTAPTLAEQFSSAVHIPSEACIDNRQLLTALRIALDAHPNLTWHTETHVDSVQPHRIAFTHRQHDTVQHATYDTVVDCRGFGAETQQPDLRGVRGEIIWVHAPDVALEHAVRLMHPRYQLYIAPHANNVFACGATDIESNHTKRITVRSSLELLSALFSVSSQFAEAEIIGSYARIRPAYPDNLPRIQHQPGLMSVNGLYRHGYLLAPVVAADALTLLTNPTAQPHDLVWASRCHSHLH
ncbi:MAG: glycine oxidase ThiO [Pseudomonadota bacterium]